MKKEKKVNRGGGHHYSRGCWNDAPAQFSHMPLSHTLPLCFGYAGHFLAAVY